VDQAHAALERLARDNAAAPEDLLLVTFDDAGKFVADRVPGERIGR
jgi:hypothetical protein